MTIKTNKEYDALVAEIDNIKATISARETELLETIETIATAGEGYRRSRGERGDRCTRTTPSSLSILQEQIDSIGEKVSRKTRRRQEVISAISRPTLSVYERVRRGKGGQAVVMVRKRACGSCYKALTPKKIQEIKRNDRICTCDNCGCMLYWDDGESQ